MPIPKIYKPEEARKLLHIGRNRFYELLQRGELHAIRNGRNYLIPESCLLNVQTVDFRPQLCLKPNGFIIIILSEQSA